MELIKGLTLTLLSCALLWTLSETAARLAGFHGNNLDFEPLIFSPAYGWENKPRYDEINEELEWKIRYRTNDDGFRGKQHERQRVPDVRRVLVVSDSMGDGFGVSDEEMWQSVLERELGNKTEIVNQSVRGYDIIQEYKRWLDYGRHFAPDVVVQLLCGNDLEGWNNSVIARYRRFRPVYSIEGENLVFGSAAPPPDELVSTDTFTRRMKRLIYRSAAVNWAKHRVTPLYQRLMRRLEEDEQTGLSRAPSTHPVELPYDEIYPEAVKVVYRSFMRQSREEGWKLVLAYASTAPAPPLLAEVSREHNIPVVEIEIPPEEMFVYDPFHPRASGHRRIAAAIAEALRK